MEDTTTSSNNVNDPTAAQAQQAVLTLEGHTGNVTAIGFQRDGRYLYSGSEDGTIKSKSKCNECTRIILLTDCHPTFYAPLSHITYYFSLSNGSYTAVWDLRNASFSRSFHVGAGVNSVTLRMDRDEFISGDQNGNVKMFDLGGRGCINSVRPSAAGSTPLRVSETPSPLHETTTAGTSENTGSATTNRRKQPLYYSEGIAPIQAVDISEDSRTLVAVSNHGTVFAWDPSGRGMMGPLQEHPHLSYDQQDHDNLTVESLLRPITKFRAHAPGSYCLHAKIAPDCRHLVTTGRYVEKDILSQAALKYSCPSSTNDLTLLLFWLSVY